MFSSNPKPSRTARKKAERETKLERLAHENKEKAKVRRRDRGCRFPLCGCKKLKLALQVSHDVHKGMGGDKTGERSQEHGMVQLCMHRHQFGAVSRHRGTLRAVFLTSHGYNGPVAWEVLHEQFSNDWFRVATEYAPGQCLPFESTQLIVLEMLAEMDL